MNEDTTYAPPPEPERSERGMDDEHELQEDATLERRMNAWQLHDLPDLREHAAPGAAAPLAHGDEATSLPEQSIEAEQLDHRNEFTTVYDILDRIEHMLDAAKPVFYAPSSIRIDREALLERLQELKHTLPVQLERASALMRESERRLEHAQSQCQSIIASAQAKAHTIVQEAQEQAEFLTGQEHVMQMAQRRAQNLVGRAQVQADKLMQGAQQYSSQVMEHLQQQLNKYSADVAHGIQVLAERQERTDQQLREHEQQVAE